MKARCKSELDVLERPIMDFEQDFLGEIKDPYRIR
jgi:hypothetical protein